MHDKLKSGQKDRDFKDHMDRVLLMLMILWSGFSYLDKVHYCISFKQDWIISSNKFDIR